MVLLKAMSPDQCFDFFDGQEGPVACRMTAVVVQSKLLRPAVIGRHRRGSPRRGRQALGRDDGGRVGGSSPHLPGRSRIRAALRAHQGPFDTHLVLAQKKPVGPKTGGRAWMATQLEEMKTLENVEASSCVSLAVRFGRWLVTKA